VNHVVPLFRSQLWVPLRGRPPKLVDAKKNVVLNKLKLSELIFSLKRFGNLLSLAHNGVAGFGELRAATNDRQDKLAVVCGETAAALETLARQTAVILDQLQRTFRYLIEGKKAVALAFLKKGAETATEMATEASGLATKFDKLAELADETMARCGKIEIQQEKTDGEKRQLEHDVVDLRAKAANAKKLSEELAELRKKLQKLHTFSELPEQDAVAMLKDKSFKREAVDHMAQCRALGLICRDYSKAAGEIAHRSSILPG
jgi:hypothetical protein